MGKQSINGKAIGSNIYATLGLDDQNNDEITGPPKVLAILSAVLERSIQKNEKLVKASGGRDTVTIFHGSRAPALSIRQYIDRIFKYSSCSPSCFVVAYVYLERYLQQTDVYLTTLNVHRLLITSVMLAAKYIDDECYNNAYFAKVGGISTAEMNNLEMKLLATIDFRLHVPMETFDNYCLQLNQDGVANLPTDRVRGPVKSWSRKDGANCAPTIASYTCRAI